MSFIRSSFRAVHGHRETGFLHIAAESTRTRSDLSKALSADRLVQTGPERSEGRSIVVMLNENRKRATRFVVKAALVIASLVCEQSSSPRALAAAPGDIDLKPITVTPAVLSPGQRPNIEARVGQAPGGTDAYVVVNVIATVTRPDHRTRSWNWAKIKISRDAARTITVPKEYDTSAAGTYRVEVLVYSGDMKRRLAKRSHTFDVVERLPKEIRGKKGPTEAREGVTIDTAGQEKTRTYMGLGVYGNALNPAGGGMVLLWPSKHVGIEGIYTTGEFTSSEGRLIVKIDRSQKYSFYGGIGYIHVTTEKDIIGVATRFSDSGVSGVVGVEVALGKKVLLHVEASTARIELEQIVTSGAQTVKASVKYAPVSIGIGLVLVVF